MMVTMALGPRSVRNHGDDAWCLYYFSGGSI
jgi:hypothetical protein